jgi:hypothetical protein
MAKELEAALQQLANAGAGWVHRRDAALELGRWAAIALNALKRHQEDPDTDVRRAVGEAVTKLHLPVAPASGGGYALESLAKSCEKPGQRQVTAEGEDYIVRVVLSEGRSQLVRLTASKSRYGHDMIQILTQCGAASEKTKSWALQSNAKLVHCAFAVRDAGEQEELVLLENIPFRHATPDMVKAAVKEIAYYGDWIENRLSDDDVF